MLVLDRDQVRTVLTMDDAIAAAEAAYRAWSAGTADIPLRTAVRSPDGPGTSLLMPGYVPGEAGASGTLGAKLVSVFEGNPLRGLATVQAVFVLLNPSTGETLAVIEAAALTAIRTAAGSGAATKLLARRDASVATVFGAGAQARTQLEAVAAVRPLAEVYVFDVEQARAKAFASEMQELLQGARPGVTVSEVPAEQRDGAVSRSDIVCCATTSAEPVFAAGAVRPGTHVNAVGSYTPDSRELPEELLARASKVVVDSREAVLAEAGDLIIPLRKGTIRVDSIHAEVGEILLGIRPGRQSADEITVYKSVGMAVLDLFAGRTAYENAVRANVGTVVRL